MKTLRLIAAISILALSLGVARFAIAQNSTINTLSPVTLQGVYIVPRTTGNVFGSSTTYSLWKTATTTTLCIGSDCRTSWPAGGGGATTTVSAGGGTATGPTFDFASSTDTNMGLGISCTSATCTFTPIWIGTLADGRISSAATWNAKEPGISAGTGLQVWYGDKVFRQASTTNIVEGSNLYYTDTRARSALSVSAPLGYSTSTGAFTCTGCLTAALTSLNGSTSSTQLFSTNTAASNWGVSTLNGTHTFNFISSSTWAKIANNLSDLTNTSTARSNLGLGTLATGNFATTTGNLLVGSSTGWTALGVGSNGKVLTASSSAPLGVSWETVAGGSGISSINGDTTAAHVIATSSKTYPGANVTTSGGITTLDLQNPITFRVPHFISKIPNGSTFSSVGMSNVTAYAGSAAAQVNDSAGSWVRYSTSTVNSAAGFSTSGFYRQWLPDAAIKWRPSATSTNVLYWVGSGFNWGTAATAGTSTPDTHLAAFRYSSDLDGTTWKAITNDSSAATFTTVDTGITFTTSTAQLFRIRYPSASLAEFYINSVLVATSTTNLPGTVNVPSYGVITAPLAAGANFVDFESIAVISGLNP